MRLGRAFLPTLLATLLAAAAPAENRLAMEPIFYGGGTAGRIEVRGLEADVLQTGSFVTYDLSDLSRPRELQRVPLNDGAFTFARNGDMIGVATSRGIELIRNGAYERRESVSGTMLGIFPYGSGFLYVAGESFGAVIGYFDPATGVPSPISGGLYVLGTAGNAIYAGVGDSYGAYQFDLDTSAFDRLGDLPLPAGERPMISSAAIRGSRLYAASAGGDAILAWDISSPFAPAALAVSPLPPDTYVAQSSPLAIAEDGLSLIFNANAAVPNTFSIRRMSVSSLPGTLLAGGIDLGGDGTVSVIGAGSQRIAYSQGYYPKFLRFADTASSSPAEARESCTIVQPVSGISGNFLYSPGTQGAVDISEPSDPQLREIEPLDYNSELITGHTVTGGDGIRAMSLDQSVQGDAILKIWRSRNRRDPVAETVTAIDRSVSGGPIFDSFSQGRAFLSIYPADGVQPYQLRLVDVRTPGAPRTGLLPVPGGADFTASFPAAASEDRAYVIAKGAILCFDVANPENPTLRGQYALDEFSTVRLHGAHEDRVFATFRTSGSLEARIIDFSNPSAPTVAETFPTALQSNTLSIGSFQYPLWAIAQTDGAGTALDVFDVTLPAASQPIYSRSRADDTNTPTSFHLHGGLLIETLRLGALRINRLYRSDLQRATADQLLGIAPGAPQNDANADGVVCAGDLSFESQ